ncbi:hypothetical protein [Oceanicola sp. 22II-s10i]|uniref:hypothetical protein n=1 Tax=Oceanicola sp. 22II-s10i TaxID=1317116 RepID=UPI000B51E78C|nr:hypothetical protein [Oceanicola sp. 22II-s10i]
MKHDTQTDDLSLRAELMRHFADVSLQHGGGTRHEGPGAFTYACLSREKLTSITMPNPVLGIVLRGA